MVYFLLLFSIALIINHPVHVLGRGRSGRAIFFSFVSIQLPWNLLFTRTLEG